MFMFSASYFPMIVRYMEILLALLYFYIFYFLPGLFTELRCCFYIYFHISSIIMCLFLPFSFIRIPKDNIRRRTVFISVGCSLTCLSFSLLFLQFMKSINRLFFVQVIGKDGHEETVYLQVKLSEISVISKRLCKIAFTSGKLICIIRSIRKI